MHLHSCALLRVTLGVIITVSQSKDSIVFCKLELNVIDKKIMLKIWFNLGLNSTIFRGTGHRRLSAQLGLVSLIGKQPFFALYLELYSDKLLFPLTVPTVFIRLYAMEYIKFLAFPIWRLFKGSVYFEITFFKSLTTVIVNHLWILYNLKVPMSPLFCWDRIINVWMV